MKKVLILSKDFELSKKYLKAARELDIKMTWAIYDQVGIEYLNKTNIYCNNIQLSDFDIIHFRNIGRFSEIHTTICDHAIENKIKISSPCFLYKMPWYNSKAFTYQRLVSRSLPVIESVLLKNPNKIDELALPYPLIAKTTQGSEGQGVFLCDNQKSLDSLLKKHSPLLLQKYIKNTGDYRVIVVGNKVLGTIKRMASQNEFRNNVALGGTAQVVNNIDNELEQIAIEATKSLGYAVAGVDIIFDELEKKYKIIEVNLGPKFLGFEKATGINVAKSIIEYLNKITD